MDKLSVFRRLRANPEKYVPMSLQELLDTKHREYYYKKPYVTVVFLRHDVACSGILLQIFEKMFNYEWKRSQNEGFITITLRENLPNFRPEFMYLFDPKDTDFKTLKLPFSAIVNAHNPLDEAPNFDCFAVFSEGGEKLAMRHEHINFFGFARDHDDRFRFVDPDGFVAKEILRYEGKGFWYDEYKHFDEYPEFLFSSNEPPVLETFLKSRKNGNPIYKQLSVPDLYEGSRQYRLFSAKRGGIIVVNPTYNIFQHHHGYFRLGEPRSEYDRLYRREKKIMEFCQNFSDKTCSPVKIGHLDMCLKPLGRPNTLVVFEVLNEKDATEHLETLPKAPTNYVWKTGDVAALNGAAAPMASMETANAVAHTTSSSAASQLPVSAKRVRSNPPHARSPGNNRSVISISPSGTPPAVRPRPNDGDAAFYYVDSRTPSPMVVDDDDVEIIESPKHNDNNNNNLVSKRPKTKRGGRQRRTTAKRRQPKAYRIQRSTRRRWIK